MLHSDWKNTFHVAGRTEVTRRHYSNGVIRIGSRRGPAADAKKVPIPTRNFIVSVGERESSSSLLHSLVVARYGIPEQTLQDIDGKNPVQITGRTEYKRRHYSNSVIAGGGNREPAAHAKKIGILRVNSWSAFETGMLELAAASNPSVWAQPWYSGSDVAGQRLEEPPSSTSQENPEKISEIQERPY